MISHRIDKPRSRLASVLYTEFVDHGFLRHLWTNVKEIDDGLYRSNHPSATRLRRFKAAGGAVVLSLRGGQELAQNVLERDACEKIGLEFACLSMSASELPDRTTVLDLVEMFRNLQRPVLMHCKSGADRTGLASGIYLMAFKGVPPNLAARQLTWKHAHNRFSKKGKLREFFTMYQPAYESGQGFEDWVKNDYDPA